VDVEAMNVAGWLEPFWLGHVMRNESIFFVAARFFSISNS